MANQIRMTPDSMRERAAEYQRQSDIVGDVIDRMDALLSQLREEWEGAASEAYEAKYGELRPGFVSMRELIAEICIALNKTAEAVERTDSEIASKFSI